jgi:sugar transferase (PEP-CTERM/EpsH1 system associated)
MKVLIISPRLPWPPRDGGSIRVFQTLRHLSTRHSITLATSVVCEEDLTYKSALEEFCEKVVVTVHPGNTAEVLSRLCRGLLKGLPLIHGFYYNAELAAQIANLTFETPYDIVQVEFPFMMPYLKTVSPRYPTKKILSMHNIESLRFKRELQLSRWRKRQLLLLADRFVFPNWEEGALQHFNGIITVSEMERKWVENRVPGTIVETVPNGVDTAYFTPNGYTDGEGEPYIIFTGAMDYPPNVDAAVWLCKEIFPELRKHIPTLGVKIVGKNPAKEVLALDKGNGVVVTGTVEDIRSYIAGALAAVVPLRSGGGTRLKILEAMAMGRPVVSTTVGAEGLRVRPATNILLADDPAQFIAHIEFLMKSPTARRSLGESGRRLVVENYDWQLCFGGLDRFYASLCGDGGG